MMSATVLAPVAPQVNPPAPVERAADVAPWDPWKALTAREDIILRWAWLPDGLYGTARRVPDGWEITLETRLDRVARRCVLAHELVHVEREIVELPRLSMQREEAIVRAETARRLVPPALLEKLIAQRDSLGEGVEEWQVAEEFDVTRQVARDAADVLRRIWRGQPLSEFATAWDASR